MIGIENWILAKGLGFEFRASPVKLLEIINRVGDSISAEWLRERGAEFDCLAAVWRLHGLCFDDHDCVIRKDAKCFPCQTQQAFNMCVTVLGGVESRLQNMGWVKSETGVLQKDGVAWDPVTGFVSGVFNQSFQELIEVHSEN